MRPRVRHFWAVWIETSISAASIATEGQLFRIWVVSMQISIDPDCPVCKPILSADRLGRLGQTVRNMANREISTYQRGVRRRIKTIREAMGWTQQEMANALGLPLETYRKYELRSMMPLHILTRFHQVSGHSLEYIITGKYPPPSAETGLPIRRAQ